MSAPPQPARLPGRDELRARLAVVICYLSLLYLTWGWLAREEGFFYEIYVALGSTLDPNGPWIEVLAPLVMPTRVLTSLPYVICHQMGQPVAALQVFWGLNWLAMGTATSLIVRRVTESRWASLCAGALALTSTCDLTFAQLDVFAIYLCVTWFVLALWLLLKWIQDGRALVLVLSCVLLAASQWTYDAALTGLLAPVVCFLSLEKSAAPGTRRRALTATAAWGVTSAPYVVVFLRGVIDPTGYAQTGGIVALSGLEHLLRFGQMLLWHFTPWAWGFARPSFIARSGSVLPEQQQVLLAAAGAVVFALSSHWVARSAPSEGLRASGRRLSSSKFALGCLVMAVASLAVFARVQVGDFHYRSQIFSGVCFAIFFAVVADTLRWRTGAAICVSAMVFFGVKGGLDRQDFLAVYSRLHARELASIISQAPGIRPEAQVVLYVPPLSGFLATEAQYLAQSALGYLYQDASLPPRVHLWSARRGTACRVQHGLLECTHDERCTDFNCATDPIAPERVLLFRYRAASNTWELEPRLPADLLGEIPPAVDARYAPLKLIEWATPSSSALAVIRYGQRRADAPPGGDTEGLVPDEVASASLPPASSNLEFGVDQAGLQGGAYVVSGWAALRGAGATGQRVQAVLFGEHQSYVVPARPFARPDVSSAFPGLDRESSGFRVELPLRALPSGSYRVALLLTRDGEAHLRETGVRFFAPP